MLGLGDRDRTHPISQRQPRTLGSRLSFLPAGCCKRKPLGGLYCLLASSKFSRNPNYNGAASY